MVTIYTTPSCSSCRKAKKWLDEFGIEYLEKNIFNVQLLEDDILSMLENSENGFDDIISTRSNFFKTNTIDLDELKTSELVKLIIKNPSILRRPIIIDKGKMQVGYNDEEIRVFIPEEQRKILMEELDEICDSCEARYCEDEDADGSECPHNEATMC